MATIQLRPLQDAMNAYALALHQQAQERAEQIATYVKDRTVERARADEAWASLADEIEVWSQDGQYVVGVRDNEMASRAFQIEYGDEVRPPAPLFRLMGRDLANAHQLSPVRNTTTTQGYSASE